MKRVFAPILFLATFALAACGGHTGIEVIIEPPPSAVPGVVFTKIRVTATNMDLDAYAHVLREFDETPYLVYVIAGYEKAATVRIDVEFLREDNSVVDGLKDSFPSVKFEPGKMKELLVDFRE